MASSSKLVNPNPNPNPNPNHSSSTPTPTPPSLLSSPSDTYLSTSSILTRPELLRRRLCRLRQLSKVYKDHYWALMEEVRVQYRDYYWKYGVSPYKPDDDNHNDPDSNDREREREREREFNGEGCGESNNNTNVNVNVNGGSGGKLGLGEEGKVGVGVAGSNRCAFVGCKLKAMALTSFCHLHILSDPEQKLYKACNFVIKSAQAGPILCGKPILRSTIPSLCNIHYQKAQKHATRALKKAGLNVSASSKLAPKIHVVIAEYVNQIQSKRRTVQKAGGVNIAIKEESMS